MLWITLNQSLTREGLCIKRNIENFFCGCFLEIIIWSLKNSSQFRNPAVSDGSVLYWLINSDHFSLDPVAVISQLSPAFDLQGEATCLPVGQPVFDLRVYVIMY